MEALKFELFGKVAHFKNPESNIKIELSYENIPKTVIMGVLGALIGLRGRQHFKKLGYIEYWEELRDLKVSIIPGKPKWRKHIDNLNNSTGFGNDGDMQNLNRQILEGVSWVIYIDKSSIKEKYWTEICDSLISRQSNYSLYLGKTEFKARLGKVEIVRLTDVSSDEVEFCDSIVPYRYIDDIEKDKVEEHRLSKCDGFVRSDYYPVGLDKYGLYKLDKFIFTNLYLNIISGNFYKDKSSVITFF